MNAAEVQVYLVDDEPDVTRGLGWLLESVGQASQAFSDPLQFLDRLDRAGGPACAVLDMRMPNLSGIELIERMAALRPDIPSIILTAHGDVPNAVRAMKLGAIDFLQKPFNPQQFLECIQRARGEALRRHEAHARQREQASALAQLSGREREVFEQLLVGDSSKEIGRFLNISHKTVDVHRANILRKLGAATARELAARFRHPGAA